MQEFHITVNGMEHTICAEPNTILLNVLRDRLDLTGAKCGCGTGDCGACTVIMDGEAVRSCVVP
ncbi:MAG: 2Fe-2S iron-sulfur cluster binding domain-containing protein, partial [Clostridia bacterium]|nr:2Fe-2S iron-sulfur cluster binding domain-containing protein [Clostridia bacterium]